MKKIHLLLSLLILSKMLFGQCYNTSQTINVGTSPKGCASQLLDGGPNYDVAVANSISNNVSFLFGNGNGTFQTAVNTPVGNNPLQLVIGDMDNNGSKDVVVCNEADNTVEILYCTAGVVTSTLILNTGQSPRSVAISDLNGDNQTDIVTANLVGNNVSVLINTGSHTFTSAQNFSAGTGPVFVIITQLAGDAIPDLAVANYFGNSISLLQGIGNGTFGLAQNISVGSSPVGIAAIPANQDAFIDFAVCNEASDNISVLINSGSNTFQSTTYPVGDSPTCIISGECTGDAFFDIAVAAGGYVSILPGFGNGSFNSTVDVNVGTYPYSLTCSDFNNDGKGDVFATDNSNNNGFVVFTVGTGLFSAPVLNSVCNNSIFTIGDVNNDTIPDMIISKGNTSSDDTVFVYIGIGNGTFQQPIKHHLPTPLGRSVIGDFNSDGKKDLVICEGYGVYFLPGNGNGTFGASTYFYLTSNGFYPAILKAGDFNGDGKLDVMTADGSSTAFNGRLLFSDGLGGFPTIINSPMATSWEIHDFDNDGDLDEVEARGNVIIENKNNGSGIFTQNVQTLPNPIDGFCSGDFNNDGKLDVISFSASGFIIYYSKGNGNFTFQAATTISTPYQGGKDFVAADFDHDGNLDFIFTETNNNNLYFYKGLGNGTFAAAIQVTGSGSYEATCADFDHNNSMDYAKIGTSSVASIYLNCFSFAPPVGVLGPNIFPDHASINIYPNPASSFARVTIDNSNSSSFNDYEIAIFDLLGRKVDAVVRREDKEFNIETESLPGGIYFVKLFSRSDKQEDFKAVKLMVQN